MPDQHRRPFGGQPPPRSKDESLDEREPVQYHTDGFQATVFADSTKIVAVYAYLFSRKDEERC